MSKFLFLINSLEIMSVLSKDLTIVLAIPALLSPFTVYMFKDLLMNKYKIFLLISLCLIILFIKDNNILLCFSSDLYFGVFGVLGIFRSCLKGDKFSTETPNLSRKFNMLRVEISER